MQVQVHHTEYRIQVQGAGFQGSTGTGYKVQDTGHRVHIHGAGAQGIRYRVQVRGTGYKYRIQVQGTGTSAGDKYQA